MKHPSNLPDCLLLTATVVPQVSMVQRSDPNDRLEDYLSALEYYAECTDLPILVLENSGYPIEMECRYQALASQRDIEILHFNPEPDVSRGKGFQEFAMIDKAINILGGRINRFIKITGRYQAANFKMLTSGQKPLCIDLHRLLGVAITSFFICDTSFYKQHIKGLYKKAFDEEGVFIEHVLYDYIIENNLLSQVELLPETPVFEGLSGSYGGSLQRHPLKVKLRNAERKALRLLGRNEFIWEY